MIDISDCDNPNWCWVAGMKYGLVLIRLLNEILMQLPFLLLGLDSWINDLLSNSRSKKSTKTNTTPHDLNSSRLFFNLMCLPVNFVAEKKRTSSKTTYKKKLNNCQSQRSRTRTYFVYEYSYIHSAVYRWVNMYIVRVALANFLISVTLYLQFRYWAIKRSRIVRSLI